MCSLTQQAQNLFATIKEKINFSNWLISLDRDGTLVPIMKNPKDAQVDNRVSSLLTKMAIKPNVHVAIVSARSLKQLRSDFDDNLILAGNYGLEISYPKESIFIHPEAIKAEPYLKAVKDKLISWCKKNPNAILDDHQLSLCMHWHLLPPTAQNDLHDMVAQLKDENNHLNIRTLPTSYEFLPKIHWNKANTLEHIDKNLKTVPDKWFYMYIGDSESDEPGFEWVNEKDGVTVYVGNRNNHTKAAHQVDNPEVVYEFLKILSNFKD